jgi:hypothetical protein
MRQSLLPMRLRAQNGMPWRAAPCGVAPISRRSALRVVGEALPVDHHTRFVANDPGIMPGRADHQVTGAELVLGAIVHLDFHLGFDGHAPQCTERLTEIATSQGHWSLATRHPSPERASA